MLQKNEAPHYGSVSELALFRIIDLLVEEGIGTLVIGNNPLWKQEANRGGKTISAEPFPVLMKWKREGNRVEPFEDSFWTHSSDKGLTHVCPNREAVSQ